MYAAMVRWKEYGYNREMFEDVDAPECEGRQEYIRHRRWPRVPCTDPDVLAIAYDKTRCIRERSRFNAYPTFGPYAQRHRVWTPNAERTPETHLCP